MYELFTIRKLSFSGYLAVFGSDMLRPTPAQVIMSNVKREYNE